MEVTVAMLLAAIVIGITYAAFSIVNKSYLSFHNKNDNRAVLIRLDELLQKDFTHFDVITKTPNGLLFRNDRDSVKYELDSALILRTSTITDTFKVITAEMISTFNGQPVAADKAQNIIDDVGLTILFENEKIPYHYHKDYSSANLIEYNPNAIN